MQRNRNPASFVRPYIAHRFESGVYLWFPYAFVFLPKWTGLQREEIQLEHFSEKSFQYFGATVRRFLSAYVDILVVC